MTGNHSRTHTGGPRTFSAFEFALGYAARGWSVFVLSPTKTPIRNCPPCHEGHNTAAEMESCACLTCHGFYAATTDPARIEEMLSRHSGGLLAVRTGAISGLAVVDVDFRTWQGAEPSPNDAGWLTMSKLDSERLLPGTLMQTTGSGGLHFLYAHPGGYLMSGGGKYGPQVDSKADGGYIVVAPSVSRSGPYCWTGDGRFVHPLTALPEALAERVRPPVAPPAFRSVVTPWTRPGVARGRLQGLVQTVLDAVEGERSDKLHWAAKKAGEMVAAGEVDERTVVDVLADAGRAIGLTVNEIGDSTRGTIASGLRKGRLVA